MVWPSSARIAILNIIGATSSSSLAGVSATSNSKACAVSSKQSTVLTRRNRLRTPIT
jgi:hypothetical protein